MVVKVTDMGGITNIAAAVVINFIGKILNGIKTDLLCFNLSLWLVDLTNQDRATNFNE
jgi:hypothetical protein